MKIRSFVASLLDGGAFSVWYQPRASIERAELAPRTFRIWRLGDDAEAGADRRVTPAAAAATISYDPQSRALCVDTSIVGLPPVFLYADGTRTIVASDVYLIASLLDGGLQFDPAGVADLGRLGHPAGDRTLFRNARRLPSGARITVSADRRVAIERTWRLPPPSPVDAREFLERQIAAFTDATRRIELSRSLLSLTGGLDTRTILTTLAGAGRLVPAATMCGERPSLDAQYAARLCRAYGAPHVVVEMDAEFRRRLPEYVKRASILSGGVASVSEAAELHFYERLRDRFAARLSGNLGNQLGRGGTEGRGTRGAALDILAPAFRELAPPSDAHWHAGTLARRDATEFILQHEFPAALAGNYTIGSHFAVQQSPYADRALIETLSCRPDGSPPPLESTFRMRARDLRHRFLGEPASTSFQRTLVNRLGGFAARCPINFGWTASGVMSWGALARGGVALAGMVAASRRLDHGPLGRLIDRTGVVDLHDVHRPGLWLRRDLREFTYDTLRSRDAREAGIFDGRVVDAALDDHFARGRDRFNTVAFALDVALARRAFCSSAARSVMYQVV